MSNSVNTALGFSGGHYQGNMRRTRNVSLALARIFALLASLLVLAQIVYTLVHQEAFCLNQGCKIVESLSRVPPLVFNLTGFFFFLLIFWGLGRIRRRPYRVPPLISVLLLAAMAAEAVLMAFQLQIAQTFCLYCLCVFGCVVLLNLLLGVRQTMQGIVLFLAVFLSFSSLNYGVAAAPDQQLTLLDGAFAVRKGSDQTEEHHLFLSSTCAHCQEVVDRLEIMPAPTVFFHSVDEIKTLNLAGLEQRAQWSPEVNRELLRLLDIDSVPVLISTGGGGQELTISRGENAILSRLSRDNANSGQRNSDQGRNVDLNQSDASRRHSGQSVNAQFPDNRGGSQESDSCRVGSDCEEDFRSSAP